MAKATTPDSHDCHENCEPYGDGMCAEGCCDRCRCKICGRISTVEVAG
jgi:hypothetical protein